MNEVDIAIVIIIGFSVYHGAARGIVSGGVDLVSIPLALAIGSIGWPIVAWIFRSIGLPFVVSGVLGLVLLSSAVAVGTVYLGLWFFRNYKPSKTVDRIGGGIAGFCFGLVISALILMFSGIIPNARAPMERSALGMKMVGLVPTGYSVLERSGVVMPKLVMLPTDYRDELKGVRRGLQFMQINFSKLDGAMCMKCRTPAKFIGYRFKRGTLLSPKFECPNCGRTSDGCQTFQGFHGIYGRCPVELAEEGVRFDCGVWTNGDFITPKGECPLDGNEFTNEEEEYLYSLGEKSSLAFYWAD